MLDGSLHIAICCTYFSVICCHVLFRSQLLSMNGQVTTVGLSDGGAQPRRIPAYSSTTQQPVDRHPCDVSVRRFISAFCVARRLCRVKSRPRTTEDIKLQKHRLLTSEIKYKCLLNMLERTIYIHVAYYYACCQARCPRGLGRGSAAACLLGLGVRILPGAQTSLSREFCMLSGRGF